MQSRVRILGHPVHPMTVYFPIAFLPLLLFLDVLYYLLGDLSFWVVGFWIAVAGLATTIVAILIGIVDLAAIPNESRAHRVAFYHFIVGVAVAALYGVAILVRWPPGSDAQQFPLAALIDLLGTLVVTLQGYLGGELVVHHHIGVKAPEEGADPTPLKR